MSGGRDPKGPRGPQAPEGFDDLAGEAASNVPEEGPALAPNPELEAAMREAMDSMSGASGGEEKPEGEELVLANPIEGDPLREAHRLQQELAELHDRHLRLQADFENFRRRAAREHQDALQFGPQNLVKDLLSVVDNLDRAIDHARQSAGGDLQSLLQGVELVQRELLSVLEKHHVSEIEAMGRPFDPAYHEAMAQVPESSVPANTVIEVLQKGYQLRDRLLRPSQVVVTRASEGEASGGQGEATE